MRLSCCVPSQIIPKSTVVHLADKQILKRRWAIQKSRGGGGSIPGPWTIWRRKKERNKCRKLLLHTDCFEYSNGFYLRFDTIYSIWMWRSWLSIYINYIFHFFFCIYRSIRIFFSQLFLSALPVFSLWLFKLSLNDYLVSTYLCNPIVVIKKTPKEQPTMATHARTHACT